MTALYPLKFKPIFKDKIWGGHKIKTVLKKDFYPLNNCGELWALSGVEGDVSEIENGFLEGNDLNDLIEIYMDELVGDSVFQKFGNEFPVLIKFLNSNDYLSVQVHPDDKTAWQKHSSKGKTEMWYIIDSDTDSELIIGLKDGTDKDTFKQALSKNKIQTVLNNLKIAKGDVFYIPAGRVHAIGKGVLLAEIQQTSDITYRIYDWDRLDQEGKSREIHIENALDVIDFNKADDFYTHYSQINNIQSEIIQSPFFNVNNLALDREINFDLASRDSFTVYVCTEGNFDVKWDSQSLNVNSGECVLIPADLNDFSILPLNRSHILEVFIKL